MTISECFYQVEKQLSNFNFHEVIFLPTKYTIYFKESMTTFYSVQTAISLKDLVSNLPTGCPGFTIKGQDNADLSGKYLATSNELIGNVHDCDI